MESEGSRRQIAGPTNRKRIEADASGEEAIIFKAQILSGRCVRRCDGHKQERNTDYPERSAGLLIKARVGVSRHDEPVEVSRGHSSRKNR